MLWEHLSPPRPSGYIWSKETTPRCFKFPQTCASGSQRVDSTTSCTEEAPEILHLLRATSRSATLVCVHHITALLLLLTPVCRNDTAHLTASGLLSSQRARAHLNLQLVELAELSFVHRMTGSATLEDLLPQIRVFDIKRML